MVMGVPSLGPSYVPFSDWYSACWRMCPFKNCSVCKLRGAATPTINKNKREEVRTLFSCGQYDRVYVSVLSAASEISQHQDTFQSIFQVNLLTELPHRILKVN